jgi:phosphoribulokinase
MACETRLKQDQTLAQRFAEVGRALDRLKRYLTTGSTRVVIGANGAVTFKGWQDRDDVSDVCAYRALQSASSWELRQAVARAEAQQGIKVNPRAVAVGLHTHDNGRTWEKH